MRPLAAAGCALALTGTIMHAPAATAAAPGAAEAQPAELPAVRVNGVELHYVQRGAGVPIVFVHGGLADYRELAPVAEALPDGFLTVTYSRRHSFPNRNPPPRTDHTMIAEVDDLAALIETLGVGAVHVAGTSYGAYTALMLGLRRPDLVRSVTAAEPPILHWLADIEGGQAAHDHFNEAVMGPSAAAFAAGDPAGALAVAVEYFAGPNGMETTPAEFRDMLLANLEDWRAITTAPGVFPAVTRDEMAKIAVPVLIISGQKTAPVHRLVDPELARILPAATRIVIADGTHDMCAEQPAACAAAIRGFIGRQEQR
ncbi:MAG TPA: alpha/beta hydrolase [Sphingomicrobium sp.]|nr:alpha/beta hydrolase [Sphingomicrobium sp.]